MRLPALKEMERAAELVYRSLPPTPQYTWPLLNERAGAEVWVKHENHTPLGAFKVRGGIVYVDELVRKQPDCRGVIAATRGNHGQSIAFAARERGLKAVIVTPHGNSIEKNEAMRALGAELIEHGDDFQAALEEAARIAGDAGLHFVPSFDRALVCGVGVYSLELFRAVSDLDVLYVPIGLGSGICGAMAARDALGLRTEIVGVVAEAAPTYLKSVQAGAPVSAPVAATIADGMACRTPDPLALEAIRAGVARLVAVSEQEIREAMRLLFISTHNVAEGAGAAAVAALLQERRLVRAKRIGVVLTGGNVDAGRFAQVLVECPV